MTSAAELLQNNNNLTLEMLILRYFYGFVFVDKSTHSLLLLDY